MMEIREALSGILKGMSETLESNGFRPVLPEGVKAYELPVSEEKDVLSIRFAGKKGALRIEYKEATIAFFCTDVSADEAEDEDFKQASMSLLDPQTCDERDIKYIASEFAETIQKRYGKAAVNASKTKLPTPVSKSAAKSGALSYDPNTLTNRFTTIYPELRDAYKENIARYGQFLAEDFYVTCGNAVVMETLRSNQPQKIKKLFNLLNEIYEDGTNETQSLIAVTILGQMCEDKKLLEMACEYMSDTMKDPVIEVNRYLASGAGKRARKQMENPPPYKPKKTKEKGTMSRLMGM